MVLLVSTFLKKTFNFTIIFPSLLCTGELIGVQYLLRQTNQPPEDMSPSSERTSGLLEDIEVVDHMDQDEGFVDTLGEEAIVQSLVEPDAPLPTLQFSDVPTPGQPHAAQAGAMVRFYLVIIWGQ